MTQIHEFAGLLSQIAQEVTVRQTSDVCCGEVTFEQFQTLRYIDSAGNASIGSLSAALRVEISTMSRNISVLERNNYILRARSTEDGRIVFVRLTAKGKRALETLRCGERDIFRDVYDRLSPAERGSVIKALESLRSCLDRSNGAVACCPPGVARKSAS